MSRPRTMPRPPAGYAFPLADLTAARHFAARYGLEATILLDYGNPGADFEEVIALAAPGPGRPAWLLWRDAEHLVMRRPDGTEERFVRLSKALAALRA